MLEPPTLFVASSLPAAAHLLLFTTQLLLQYSSCITGLPAIYPMMPAMMLLHGKRLAGGCNRAVCRVMIFWPILDPNLQGLPSVSDALTMPYMCLQHGELRQSTVPCNIHSPQHSTFQACLSWSLALTDISST